MFAKELSLMAVCLDEKPMQLVLMVLIIDHLAAVHQCLGACDEILGVLSWPGHNIFKFSEVHMGVDIMCHSLVYSVEEGRSFCLGHSVPLCCQQASIAHASSGILFPGCKDILEVVLAVRSNAAEEETVLQCMPKYGERVVCIF